RRLGLALAQHGAIARRVEKKREVIREGVRSVGANPPDCIREFQSGSAALGGKGRGVESAEKGHIAEGGLGLKDLHGFGAVAAAWLVDDAAEGLVRLAIVRGCGKAQEGERVLDFGALVEADVADDDIGNARAHQGLLVAARHKVVAIEDCDFVPADALGTAALDLQGERAGFGLRVAETEDFDRVALSLLGEKGFAKPLFVFGDNGIGGGKNMPGGAEILLETDLEGIRKVAGEAADVSDVAPAPAIDRLVIVADDEETFMVGGQRFEPAILGEVDVLIFVGQEAIEPRGPEIPIVFVALQGEGWPEQQIAKISRVSLTQTILIIGIDPRAGAKTMNVERFAGAFGGGDLGFDPSRGSLWGDEIIFEFRDPVGHDLERIAAGLGFVPAAGEIERFHGSLEKAA